MRINWFSNATWFPSGYGVQTRLFAKRIQALGHPLSITAFAGLHGSPLTIDGVTHYPAARHMYGQDIIGAAADLDQADVLISLLDIWVVQPDNIPPAIPWYPWFPIDCEPMPRIVLEKARRAAKPIVMSKFGLAQMEAVGIDCYYVPHGVETDVFKPLDRAECREKLGWPQDKFIVGMVAANVGNPPRKAFFEQISAFVLFHKIYPESMLYLHCDDGSRVGPDMAVDLAKYCSVMGLKVSYMGNEPVASDVEVLFPDQFIYSMGMIPDFYLVNAYNAMDVMMLVSLGEGFGIPLIEAQACGCPVITGDWTAMGELVFGGWKIDKSKADPVWHPFFESFQYRVRPEVVAGYLCEAHNTENIADIRARAREGALAYDADRVTEEFWKPVLADMEARLVEKPAGKVTRANGQTERVVEIPWLLKHLGKPGSILDIGSADAWYLSELVKTGATVTGLDTRPFEAPAGVTAIVGDAAQLPADWESTVDLVTCVSVLDHVGLEAYGNGAQDGQLHQVIETMRCVLRAGGRLLLTVPVGEDCLTSHPGGGQRVFDRNALTSLFPDSTWDWKSETYWTLFNDAYVQVDWDAAEGAQYESYRAGAVAGLELVKR